MMSIDFNSDEETFFHALLKETDLAYKKTSLFKSHPNWSYSVCATPIARKQGLILGLNWGGGEKEVIEAQTKYPTGEDIERYSFIQKLAPFLKSHLGVDDVAKINYSNLCFFRTTKIQDLPKEDWDLSNDLIKAYIQYIDPVWILFTSTRIEQAKELLALDETTPFTAGSDKVFTAYKTFTNIVGTKIPFYALPHPNAHVREEVRKELWDDILPVKP